MNYEYEEAQVKIDLSDMILEHLVDELVTFLNGKNSNNLGEMGTEEQKRSSVEIYELMTDEPEFARTGEADGPGSDGVSPPTDLRLLSGERLATDFDGAGGHGKVELDEGGSVNGRSS